LFVIVVGKSSVACGSDIRRLLCPECGYEVGQELSEIVTRITASDLPYRIPIVHSGRSRLGNLIDHGDYEYTWGQGPGPRQSGTDTTAWAGCLPRVRHSLEKCTCLSSWRELPKHNSAAVMLAVAQLYRAAST
jgi:hypothetical protein